MRNEAVRADEEWLEATKSGEMSSVKMFTSESYHHSFWELSEHGIVIFDKNKNIIEANPTFVEMVGISAADLEGRNVSEIINPHNWNTDNINMNALIRGSYYSYSTDETIVHREGRETELIPVRVIVTRVPSTLTKKFQHFVAQIYKIEPVAQQFGQPAINQINQSYANIFKSLLIQPWFIKTALWFLGILVVMLTLSGNLLPLIKQFIN